MSDRPPLRASAASSISIGFRAISCSDGVANMGCELERLALSEGMTSTQLNQLRTLHPRWVFNFSLKDYLDRKVLSRTMESIVEPRQQSRAWCGRKQYHWPVEHHCSARVGGCGGSFVAESLDYQS